MSIGKKWAERLKADEAKSEQVQAVAVDDRAREIITKLAAALEDTRESSHLVMELNSDEATVEFERLRGMQHRSSELFQGAAKIVVDNCLRNDLDVYVTEVDFRMSGGSIGAEIHVTPHGTPFWKARIASSNR